jgi:hypothetical protein
MALSENSPITLPAIALSPFAVNFNHRYSCGRLKANAK